MNFYKFQQISIILLIIVFGILSVLNVLAHRNEEELFIETPYVAEGEVEELVQLREAGDIETFQKKLEEFIVSIFPSLRPPVISNVRVEDITINSATILWETNIKSNSLVALAEDKDYDPKRENPYTLEVGNVEERVKEHKVIVSNLKPGTLYHFQVKSASLIGIIGKSKDYTFSTLASKIELEVVRVTNNEIEVRWISPRPTDSNVEFKDLTTGRTYQTKIEGKRTIHSVTLKNLTPGTSYQIRSFGYTEDNILMESNPITIKTKLDTLPPKISTLRIDNALFPARRDRALTIISWRTDEPANSLVFFEEGIGFGEVLANKAGQKEEFVLEHTVILTTKTATIYRIQIVSADESGNEARSSIRTVLTPRGEESILDIIIKNFEETFRFLRGK